MSRKLTTAEACFELCRGAHICVSHYTNFKRPYISISNPDLYKSGAIGTITNKQYEEISQSCAIKHSSDRKDKYGNIHNYYVIEDWVLKETRAEVAKKIFADLEKTIANTASHHGITEIAVPSAPMPPIKLPANLLTIKESV